MLASGRPRTFCYRFVKFSFAAMDPRRTHIGDRMYSCQLCAFKAASPIRIARHTLTHTGEKPCPNEANHRKGKCCSNKYRWADFGTYAILTPMELSALKSSVSKEGSTNFLIEYILEYFARLSWLFSNNNVVNDLQFRFMLVFIVGTRWRKWLTMELMRIFNKRPIHLDHTHTHTHTRTYTHTHISPIIHAIDKVVLCQRQDGQDTDNEGSYCYQDTN